MRPRRESNGEGKTTIRVDDKCRGYCVFAPPQSATLPDNLPVLLSKVLEAWQRDNPFYRVRCTLPFVQDGQTVAVHVVWYD